MDMTKTKLNPIVLAFPMPTGQIFDPFLIHKFMQKNHLDPPIYDKHENHSS